jgi:phytoene dehydrogenase-like protein
MGMEHAEVHVIGGGLGGLAAAAIVARSGHRVVVHEQRGRLGGRATTDDRNGFRFNQGPHALYVGGEASAVLRDLGVTPSGAQPPTRGVRMLRGGDLHVAPGGLGSLLRTRLLGSRDKLDLARLLTVLPRADAAQFAGLTVNEWVDQRTDRPQVRALLHAIVRLVTYTNAPHVLSADVAIRQLQLGLGEGVRYLDGGWQRLVDALADIVIGAGGRICPDDAAHDVPDGRAVIVAVGSCAQAADVTGHPYPDGVVTEASVLDLALARTPPHPFVIGVDEPIYLSDHGIAAGMCPDGRASVSLAHYLAPGDAPDRGRLRAVAERSGIVADQILDERYLHRMTTVSSIATASSGGLAGRAPVRVPDRPGVFVVGDWVGDRGHLADAVLASARAAANAAVAHLSEMRAVR